MITSHIKQLSEFSFEAEDIIKIDLLPWGYIIFQNQTKNQFWTANLQETFKN